MHWKYSDDADVSMRTLVINTVRACLSTVPDLQCLTESSSARLVFAGTIVITKLDQCGLGSCGFYLSTFAEPTAVRAKYRRLAHLLAPYV